jgi:hypothetical protein
MRHLSYANVMATVAVFLALGGVSYAAIKIPKSSVGTKQLKLAAVTGSRLRTGAVTSVKVRNGSLTGEDIKISTLGKVPTAAKADLAARATVADKLGEDARKALLLRCPGNSVPAFGLCLDLKAHPDKATYDEARKVCAADGGTPPGWWELDAIRQRTDITWGGDDPAQYEWTSDPSASGALALDRSGNRFDGAATVRFYYRCLRQPVNG